MLYFSTVLLTPCQQPTVCVILLTVLRICCMCEYCTKRVWIHIKLFTNLSAFDVDVVAWSSALGVVLCCTSQVHVLLLQCVLDGSRVCMQRLLLKQLIFSKRVFCQYAHAHPSAGVLNRPSWGTRLLVVHCFCTCGAGARLWGLLGVNRSVGCEFLFYYYYYYYYYYWE